MAQAVRRRGAQQSRRPADHAVRTGLRAGRAAAVGRRHVVYRLLRRRPAVHRDDVHRFLRVDVLGFLAHARPEDVGRYPLRAAHHRRHRRRRNRLGREQGMAHRLDHPRRGGGVRPGELAVGGARAAGGIPGWSGLLRPWPGHVRARTRLGLLQLLHDARDDADDDDFGGVLSRRAAAGAAAGGGQGAAALPRGADRAAAGRGRSAGPPAAAPGRARGLCCGRLRARHLLRAQTVFLLTMLWVKSLHIVFMVTWFAGLFYLPRLFVYHAGATDSISLERFKVMERKLFWGIMTPGAVLTIAFGVWLWLGWFRPASGWLHAKITLVALLAAYHLWCWRLMRAFAAGRNQRSHVWYRWFNEFPTVVLFATVLLVVFKPF